MGVTVLCVDDESETRGAYRRFLEPAYAVRLAADAEAALADLAGGAPPEVVVADLWLPGMHGVEFLATVRRLYPDAVRVLITGNADLQTALRAVNDGNVFRLLTKPCPPAEFRATVDAAAAQHRLIVSDRLRMEEALRASEECSRAVLDSVASHIAVLDRAGVIVAVNAAWTRFAAENGGGSRVGVGTNYLDVCRASREAGAAEAGAAAEGIRAVLDRTRTSYGLEYPCHAPDRQRWFLLSATPLGTAAGGAVVQHTDVTDRRQAEEQLRQAQKLESIGQLAAGIAHEINTPIQYIGDNTHFLGGAFGDLSGVLAAYRAAGTDPAALAAAAAAAEAADLDYLLDEAPRAVAQTLEGIDHVARIVRAMKEYAHPGTEEKAPVDLNHAVETVIAVARNEWKYAADVVTDLDPDLPVVAGLAGELNQVLLNLLVNAAHAVRAAGGGDGAKGTITISTRRAGAAVEVRVADTGCGIPEEHRGRVFDPYFTTKPVGQGTGQGLALVHAAVVQRHGGSVSFESEVGRGTTFVVRLPAYGDRVARSEQVRAAATRRVLPGGAG